MPVRLLAPWVLVGKKSNTNREVGEQGNFLDSNINEQAEQGIWSGLFFVGWWLVGLTRLSCGQDPVGLLL